MPSIPRIRDGGQPLASVPGQIPVRQRTAAANLILAATRQGIYVPPAPAGPILLPRYGGSSHTDDPRLGIL
jgi:hypothetical protein